MAWESRIESPVRRQHFVTALMVGLLAAATAMAAWYSHSHRQRMVTWTHAPFTVALPGAHLSRPIVEQGEMVAEFYDRSDTFPRTRVYRIDSPTVALPIEIAERLELHSGWTDQRSYQVGPAHVLQASSVFFNQTEGTLRTYLRVQTISTVDANAYLVIVTDYYHTDQTDHIERIQRIARTIEDKRFVPIERERVDLGGVSCELPEGVIGFEHDEASRRRDMTLHVAPERSEHFYRLRISVPTIPEDLAGLSAQELCGELARRQVADVWGDEPPTDATDSIRHGRRQIEVVHLMGVTGRKRYDLWAVPIDNDRVLTIQVIADPRSYVEASRIAGWIATHAQADIPEE